MVDESAIPVSEWSCVRSPIICAMSCDITRDGFLLFVHFLVPPLTTTTTTTPHHAHIPRDDDDRPTD